MFTHQINQKSNRVISPLHFDFGNWLWPLNSASGECKKTAGRRAVGTRKHTRETIFGPTEVGLAKSWAPILLVLVDCDWCFCRYQFCKRSGDQILISPLSSPSLHQLENVHAVDGCTRRCRAKVPSRQKDSRPRRQKFSYGSASVWWSLLARAAHCCSRPYHVCLHGWNVM